MVQNCGIVRRVDDLGRIVIPKEMRKILRIREGDEVEIKCEDGEIALRRFSSVSTNKSAVEETLKKCALKTGGSVFFVGAEIEDGAGALRKKYVGKEPSESVMKIAKSVKDTILDGLDRVPIAKDEVLGDYAEIEAEVEVFAPVVNSGGCVGTLVALIDDKDKAQYIIFAAALLGAVLEY